MILSDTDATKIPSVAAFTAEKRLVGDEALIQADENPTNTMYEVKQRLNR